MKMILGSQRLFVIPAEAGIQVVFMDWIPALADSAGMAKEFVSEDTALSALLQPFGHFPFFPCFFPPRFAELIYRRKIF